MALVPTEDWDKAELPQADGTGAFANEDESINVVDGDQDGVEERNAKPGIAGLART